MVHVSDCCLVVFLNLQIAHRNLLPVAAMQLPWLFSISTANGQTHLLTVSLIIDSVTL